MTMYYIKSDKGYWKPQAMGYTQKQQEAGIFNTLEMSDLNLDGCTLEKASRLTAKLAQVGMYSTCLICRGRGVNEVIASPSHLMDVKCEPCNGTGKQQGEA